MGCNLCTFQKREEHYKLLYEVSQVSAGSETSNWTAKLCVVGKVGSELWLAFFFLSGGCRIEGRLAGLWAFYLGLGWQFSASLPLPLQMTSCGILFNIFWYLLPRCQSRKRGNTEIRVCHILRHLFHFGIVLTFEKQMYYCLHKYWHLIGLWSQLFWIDRKSFLPNLVSRRNYLIN